MWGTADRILVTIISLKTQTAKSEGRSIIRAHHSWRTIPRKDISHFLTTVCAKALVDPEKVSTGTNVGLDPYLPGFTSVKSVSQWAPGLVPICQEPFSLGLFFSIRELAGEVLLLEFGPISIMQLKAIYPTKDFR